MDCGYCDEQITDNQYCWKWFPNHQKMIAVHNHHLQVFKNGHKPVYYKDVINKPKGGESETDSNQPQD